MISLNICFNFLLLNWTSTFATKIMLSMLSGSKAKHTWHVEKKLIQKSSFLSAIKDAHLWWRHWRAFAPQFDILQSPKWIEKATNLFSNPRCCELFRSRFWRHLSFQNWCNVFIPIQQFSNSNKGLVFGRKKHTPGQLVIIFFVMGKKSDKTSI